MIKAEVEGVGVLEFPDGTSQDVVNRVVKQMVSGGKAPTEKTASESAVSSMAQGILRQATGQQGIGSTALQIAGGGGQYLNEKVGEGISYINEALGGIPGDIISGAASMAGQLPSIGGGTLSESVPKDIEKLSSMYQGFSEKYPVISANIESGLNAASWVYPAMKSAELAAATPDIAKKTVKSAANVPDIAKKAMKPAVNIDYTQRAVNNIVKLSERSVDDLLNDLKTSDILTLSDIAGDEVVGLTRSIGKMKGAKNLVYDALTERSEKAVTRLTNVLSKNVSNVDDYFANIDELAAKRQLASRPLYKKAFAQSERINNKSLDKFLQDKRIIDAINVAKQEYGVRLEAPSNSLEALDGVKRVLYDLESSAKKSGKSNLSYSYGSLRRDLVKILDKESPIYKKARKVYETPSQMIDAQEAGRNFNKLDPSQIKKVVKDLQPHELESYKIGVRQKMQEIISKVSDTSNPAKRLFGNDYIRNQIKAVFGDGEKFNEFAKRLNDEIRAFETKTRILGGSRTDYNIASDDGFIDAVADASRRGVLAATLDRTLTATTEAIKRRYRGITSKNAKEIAEILVDRKKGIEALEKTLLKQKDLQQKSIIKQIIESHAPIIILQKEE